MIKILKCIKVIVMLLGVFCLFESPHLIKLIALDLDSNKESDTTTEKQKEIRTLT